MIANRQKYYQNQNIPFSLAMRINRICSDPKDREKYFLELKNMLEKRKYPSSIIEAAIAKSRAIPRETALRKVVRQDTQSRPVFVALYDPRTQKHWKSMVTQDKYLEEVFPKPPLVAYKRQQNIKDIIFKKETI